MRVNGDPLNKVEIAQELWNMAVKRWGPQEAESLRSQINDTADWISLIGHQPLEIWADEPDYLTGLCTGWQREEGR